MLFLDFKLLRLAVLMIVFRAVLQAQPGSLSPASLSKDGYALLVLLSHSRFLVPSSRTQKVQKMGSIVPVRHNPFQRLLYSAVMQLETMEGAWLFLDTSGWVRVSREYGNIFLLSLHVSCHPIAFSSFIISLTLTTVRVKETECNC